MYTTFVLGTRYMIEQTVRDYTKLFFLEITNRNARKKSMRRFLKNNKTHPRITYVLTIQVYKNE